MRNEVYVLKPPQSFVTLKIWQRRLFKANHDETLNWAGHVRNHKPINYLSQQPYQTYTLRLSQ